MLYSEKIYNRIAEFLDKEEWKYFFDKDKGTIALGVNLSGKISETKMIIDLGEEEYIVLGMIALKVSSSYRVEIIKLLNKINYGMKFGCFEMDDEDGEIRFRIAVDCEGCIPSLQVVKKSIIVPALMIQKYGDEILNVMLGVKDAESAYEAAERQKK